MGSEAHAHRRNSADVDLSHEVGSGFSKVVYRGTWNTLDIAASRMLGGGEHREARLSERLPQHPNLVTYHLWHRQEAALVTEARFLRREVDADGNEYGITELMKMGSLVTLLRRHGRQISLEQKRQMCLQICDAMVRLASALYVHRDLAARNVLVHNLDPVLVKVADFDRVLHVDVIKNLASAFEVEMVPVLWSPPEVLRSLAWSEKSDVWSFGVTTWEIFTNGREPYLPACPSLKEAIAHVLGGGILEQPANCPNEIYKTIAQSLRYNPEDRPTFVELKRMLEGTTLPTEIPEDRSDAPRLHYSDHYLPVTADM